MIKLFEQYNEYSQVKQWLDLNRVSEYTINDDLTVDVYSRVYLQGRNLTELPIQFGKVNGDFLIGYNKLTTLKGSPINVTGDFLMSDNDLTSLEYAPEYVGGNFNCKKNNLTTLEGSPKYIGRIFNCINNKLTSLIGLPEQIDGNLLCENNKLTNLKYIKNSISGRISYFNNPLPREILKFDNSKLLIKHQDDYGLWNTDGTFNKARWEIFLQDFEAGLLD